MTDAGFEAVEETTNLNSLFGTAAPELRGNQNGIVKLRLDGAGKWFVKFINMSKLNDPNLNYESKWTTLTFELK